MMTGLRVAVADGVPTPRVTVSVGRVGIWVAVNVGGCAVWVGALVAVITTGVLLGASVGDGRDWRVCSTCAATVDWMSGMTGAGFVAWG